MSLQSCLKIICSNTINEYNFGTYCDAPGKTRVRAPGTYHVGNFSLHKQRTGFFEEGKFKVKETRNGPSRRELLNFMLQYAPEEHPIIAQRIRASM